MRGLILAAGRGRRMGAATDERPKALLAVGGRTLLAWQLAAFARAGVRDVALVRGYRGAEIAFDGPSFENARWAESGIAASLAAAEAWLAAGPTVVSYADLVYPAEAVRAIAAAPGEIAVLHDPAWLALWRRRFDDPLEDAERFRADAHGRVLAIGGRPDALDEVEGQYMGLFRLTPRGAERLLARWRALDAPARDRADVTGLLALLVAEGEEVRAVAHAGWWCEIDRARDLRVAEEIVREAGAP